MDHSINGVSPATLAFQTAFESSVACFLFSNLKLYLWLHVLQWTTLSMGFPCIFSIPDCFREFCGVFFVFKLEALFVVTMFLIPKSQIKFEVEEYSKLLQISE